MAGTCIGQQSSSGASSKMRLGGFGGLRMRENFIEARNGYIESISCVVCELVNEGDSVTVKQAWARLQVLVF